MSDLKELKDIRETYDKGELRRARLSKDPFGEFRKWLEIALTTDGLEANAMILGTTNLALRPALRTVLLKELTTQGFVFYTSYSSRKGREIEENPNASLLFFWPPLQQQIRIEGTIAKVNEETSTAYFQSRPLGSQLGAWASNQSEVIRDREVIEKKLKGVQQKFAQTDPVPKPPYWGGYVLIPDYFEFWQGRMDRLHDRFSYSLDSTNGEWTIERLSP